jgi:hypothetical protein
MKHHIIVEVLATRYLGLKDRLKFERNNTSVSSKRFTDPNNPTYYIEDFIEFGHLKPKDKKKLFEDSLQACRTLGLLNESDKFTFNRVKI